MKCRRTPDPIVYTHTSITTPNLDPILSVMDRQLSENEIEDILSLYGGDSPSSQYAFDKLNAKALSNLVRSMDFEQLQTIEKENRPSHMEYFIGKYFCLSKFLDEDQRCRIDSKFWGRTKKTADLSRKRSQRTKYARKNCGKTASAQMMVRTFPSKSC